AQVMVQERDSTGPLATADLSSFLPDTVALNHVCWCAAHVARARCCCCRHLQHRCAHDKLGTAVCLKFVVVSACLMLYRCMVWFVTLICDALASGVSGVPSAVLNHEVGVCAGHGRDPMLLLWILLVVSVANCKASSAWPCYGVMVSAGDCCWMLARSQKRSAPCRSPALFASGLGTIANKKNALVLHFFLRATAWCRGLLLAVTCASCSTLRPWGARRCKCLFTVAARPLHSGHFAVGCWLKVLV
ncbi:hypothetical protein COO60DRAFT_1486622, partial [Scenedesmus sp. NREL 46B-D3]